jgi:hypothetical protein
MAAEKKAAEKKAAAEAAGAAAAAEAAGFPLHPMETDVVEPVAISPVVEAAAPINGAATGVSMETDAVAVSGPAVAMETEATNGAHCTPATTTSSPPPIAQPLMVATEAGAVDPAPVVPVAPLVLVDPVAPVWRQQLVQASTVTQLAVLLRQLIENLGPRALKLSWEKPVVRPLPHQLCGDLSRAPIVFLQCNSPFSQSRLSLVRILTEAIHCAWRGYSGLENVLL